MYNAHPYFPLKILGKESAHYTWQKMGNRYLKHAQNTAPIFLPEFHSPAEFPILVGILFLNSASKKS